MAEHPLILRYAARSHVGLVRAKNDDSAYVGKHLAVVADGMGGHAGGDVASASTVLDLIHLDHDGYRGDGAGTDLADEIQTANSLLSELVHVNPKLAGMGTTVTALLLSGERLAYAHIGDSRAYRLKNGVFEQMSTDHTFVQRMIEEGRMTEAEAEVHPHKNVLMRVLGDVDASPELDLTYFDAEPGERWLLCSDGLNFVRHETVEEVFRTTSNLAHCAETLIDLTLAVGSPDNVTVVVFEVAEAVPDDTATAALETISVPVNAETASDDDLPILSLADTHRSQDDDGAAPLEDFGAAAVVRTGGGEAGGDESDGAGDSEARSGETIPANTERDEAPTDGLDAHIRAAVVRHELSLRPHELVGAAVTANAEGKIPQLAHHPATQRAATVLTHKPVKAAATEEDTEQSLPRARYRTWVFSVLGVLAVIAVVAGAWTAYVWTQTQYFVGVSHNNVAIFQGVSQNLGPISLSHLQRETTVSVDSLPEYSQQLVVQTMPASSLGAAEQIISDLQLGTGSSTPPCSQPAATPSPSGTAKATHGGSSTARPSATSAKPSAKPSVTASAKPTAKPSAKPTAKGTATPSSSASATPTCTPGGGQ
ncbi:serine/threonine protein phosphatase [Arthrobacter livingstonensis]|uniref:Serine/threonine protein phosphatase n=1 Tax=Arthrobacter livingstonensis TaxID=670078 RepID=A0A2V5LC17_9MICC|nr:protein phosphatase 2C domain-containing protein [Arthrobacter livingstonensis]PYI68074.1 serine/threonine protein phosphatase [Arthrobacter livingstonensis]